MRSKTPLADAVSITALPPVVSTTSATSVPDAVEAWRAKLKRIFAMMSNTPGGEPPEGDYGNPLDPPTRTRGPAQSSQPNHPRGSGGRIPPSALKEGVGPASQGIERTLHRMSQTLHRLLGDLDHSRDGCLPSFIASRIEEDYQRCLEQLAQNPARGNRSGQDSFLFGGGGNGKESLEWRLQLQRARTAAADEVYALEKSVTDYATEPPIPREQMRSPSMSPSPPPGPMLSTEMEIIADAIRKIRESTNTITGLHNNISLPWWSSPLRTRDMKIATIRLNYHARHALLWDWRCHNQLLIRATQLNDLVYSSSVKLIKLQNNLRNFTKLIELSKTNTTTIAKEIVALQEQLKEANMRRAELEAALIAHSQKLNLVPSIAPPPEVDSSDKNNESVEKEPVNNVPVAELALLLLVYNWPEELQEDVVRVREWLRAVPTVLE
ncbi:unnamed protein product [Phytomonas sp. Hart1]|nr:unnamed protein product [Phytomonas sp. Hart1]|eukprot:CCW70438.1 unnamed protein product [Phytomonas sp. isolate Hart1]